MSPDSSSAEIDSRPQTNVQCGPIQMIQVHECTQSHGQQKLQQISQQQSQHHAIQVDYVKKLGNDNGYKITQHQPTTVFHQKPTIVQQKSDEELNLCKFSSTLYLFVKFYFPIVGIYIYADVDLEI